jgi:2'-hydroxyisoflavone reductase
MSGSDSNRQGSSGNDIGRGLRRSRRAFLKNAAAAAALAGFSAGGAVFARDKKKAKADAKPVKGKGLKILILGGTRFLGPAVVEVAQKHGHTLTLFNRGKSDPGRFPDLETLLGDRDGNLKALEGRKWDAVVDTSGYVPRIVRDSTNLLKDNVGQYLFISTLSVYSDNSKAWMDESGPLLTIPDPTNENVRENYGALKALCEQAAESVMPGRVTNVRPGLIVGPDDPSDRFTYWPVRVAKGGEVLAPGSPPDPVQFIDVRDLGAWCVKAIEDHTVGVFNAVGPNTGPKDEIGIGVLLEACNRAGGGKANFTWCDASFLEAQKVEAWSDMPVWVPPTGDSAGFARTSCTRAISKGLTFRPVPDTVKATLDWFRKEPADRQAKLKAGIAPEREAEVLAAWHAKQQPQG